MLYAACMCCVKLSLLCFIRRLAGPAASTRMIWTIWLMGVFFVCHAAGSIIVIVLWCLPVRANWDFDYRYLPNNPHVMCHDLHIWYWVSSGMHVVSDVAVLFLPIKMAWNLRMSRSKRIGVIVMFSLGSVACVCSMIRMGYIVPYVTSVDITCEYLLCDFNNSKLTVSRGLVASGTFRTSRDLFSHHDSVRPRYETALQAVSPWLDHRLCQHVQIFRE